MRILSAYSHLKECRLIIYDCNNNFFVLNERQKTHHVYLFPCLVHFYFDEFSHELVLIWCITNIVIMEASQVISIQKTR